MKKKFTAFFCIVFGLCAVSAQAEETPVDLNAPAPETAFKIRIPHTNRTKQNIKDAVLDFTFTAALKGLKDITVTYGFLEVDANNILTLSDVKIDSNHPVFKGKINIARVNANFMGLLDTIRQKRAMFEELSVADVKTSDLTITTKNGIRTASFHAEKLSVKGVEFASAGTMNEERKEKLSKYKIESVFAENARLTLKNPTEIFAAKNALVENIVFPHEHIGQLTFRRAQVDGKDYADLPSLLNALRLQKAANGVQKDLRRQNFGVKTTGNSI